MLGPADMVFNSVPVAHIPLFDRLEAVQAAGFRGISIAVGDYFALSQAGVSAAEIRMRVADAGLEVAELESVGHWLRNRDEVVGPYAAFLKDLTVERMADIAAELGARSLLVIEMAGVTVDMQTAGADFAALCDVAADHGLIAHLECLLFGGIPDLAAAWRIVRAADKPNGKLTIDAWHLFRGGSTLAELSAIPGDYIGTVQLCDAPDQAQPDAFAETMTARLLPGAGDLDVVGMIRTLDAIGSAAPIGVEVFNKGLIDRPISAIAQDWAQAARAVLSEARTGTGFLL